MLLISAALFRSNSKCYCQLFGCSFPEDTCANVYRVQIYIPKADFDGNFELAMGDSQAVHSFEAEALAGACGTSGIKYIMICADEDVEVNGVNITIKDEEKETVAV